MCKLFNFMEPSFLRRLVFFMPKFCTYSQNSENLIYFCFFFGKFQFLHSYLNQKLFHFFRFFSTFAQPNSLVHLMLLFKNACF